MNVVPAARVCYFDLRVFIGEVGIQFHAIRLPIDSLAGYGIPELHCLFLCQRLLLFLYSAHFLGMSKLRCGQNLPVFLIFPFSTNPFSRFFQITLQQ